MFDTKSFDYLLAGISLVCGIMLLTGYGDILMGGSNADMRKKIYDMKKVERASGIVLVMVGVLTFIDSFIDRYEAKIAYTVIIVALFVGLFVYIRKKCTKD